MLELKDDFVLYPGYIALQLIERKMNYTIDLLITMVTDEIAEETGKDRDIDRFSLFKDRKSTV